MGDPQTGEHQEVLPPISSFFGPAVSPLNWPHRPSPGTAPVSLPPLPEPAHPPAIPVAITTAATKQSQPHVEGPSFAPPPAATVNTNIGLV